MKNRVNFVVTFLAAIVLGCAPPQTTPSAEAQPKEAIAESSVAVEIERGQLLPITARATIGTEAIDLEVARTPAEQAIGLMYRQSLEPNQGMLFPFSPARAVTFWMKNVAIDLDMIFLRDGVVQAIAADVPPCRSELCPFYGPGDTPIDSVIELRGGRAAELGVKVGDAIAIEFFDSEQTPAVNR